MPLAGSHARFQPVWVEDVASAVVRCLDRPQTIGKVYECAGPTPYTLSELVRLAGRWSGHERPQIPLPAIAGRLQALLMEWLPGEPLMSRDNVDSMRVPNVASGRLPGLAALGIQAAALEAVAPGYLGHGFNRGALRPLARRAPAATERRRPRLPRHRHRRRGLAMQLVIGNKNYSSWSMRPWVLMRQLGLPFDEVKLRFDFAPGSAFRQAVAQYSPAGRVPVLVDDGFAVWDTLAIVEYLHERFPGSGVWPAAAGTARPRAQPGRRDARRLRRAAQPLPDEHRGRAARGRRAALGRARRRCAPTSRASSRCGPRRWPTAAGRSCSAPSAPPTPSTRRCACACAAMRCRCSQRRGPTSSASPRRRAWRPGSPTRWPSRTSSTSRSPTATPPMTASRFYVVGGAVRDALLGAPASDRDWVVVGATPEELLAPGYKPVGKDFPVFLAPAHAARKWRWRAPSARSAPGYHGFSFHAAPEVTLEEDLARRDLTINAIAQAEDGTLIDPYGGRRDLAAARAAPCLRRLRRRPGAAAAPGAAGGAAGRLHGGAGDDGAAAAHGRRRRGRRAGARARLAGTGARPDERAARAACSRCCATAARWRGCCPRSTACGACRSRPSTTRRSTPACT